MTEPLCRLSVQVEGEDLATVDIALPRTTPVGVLMPAVVDIAHRGTDIVTDVRRWRLSRIGGQPLNEWTSLDDNDIHDGELLILTTVDTPEPEWTIDDPCRVAAGVADDGHDPATRITAVAACLFAAVIGAAALAWSGVTTHAAGHLITCVAVAAAATAGAVVFARGSPDPLLCPVLSVVAVAFASAAGFLVVPSDPSAAHFLLAAAAAFPMSVVLLRLTCCGTACLTALATVSALMATGLTAGVVWVLPPAMVGAALATVSLATLSAAARLTIAVAGDVVDETRAALAHQQLTGLVIGSSTAAAVGTLLVACAGSSAPRAAMFAAVVGLVLLWRVRTHVGANRRIALSAGGLTAMAASFGAVVASAPSQANWLCVLAVSAGLGALGWVYSGVTISPVLLRAVDVVEYLALAAVVPLACWVGDLYGLVRAASLT